MGGSLTEEELQNYSKTYDVFVETGTYLGDTTLLASSIFPEVHTIEISSELSKKAREKMPKDRKVFFYLGDSAAVLPAILPDLRGKSVIFFLDAHISGSDTSFNGDDQVPLLKEIAGIIPFLLSFSKVCLILDDVRLWNSAPDWKAITPENIMTFFPPEYHYKIENDRMIISAGI